MSKHIWGIYDGDILSGFIKADCYSEAVETMARFGLAGYELVKIGKEAAA